VNQTLSQSVPAPVILAIRSVAKLFAGDIIESARKVQAQWISSDETLKQEIKKKMEEMPTPPADIPTAVMDEVKKLPVGPLEPDHLREAYRRYKLAGEGGSAGQMGLWHVQHQSGVERFATKAGGKRLFK
jgi:transcription initiation factor TFIID subunit 11